MVDQGIITGPKLTEHVELEAKYTPGYLAPWKFNHWFDTTTEEKGLALPFDSANYGAKPQGGRGSWAFSNDTAPLGSGRDSLEYAKKLYQPARGPGTISPRAVRVPPPTTGRGRAAPILTPTTGPSLL